MCTLIFAFCAAAAFAQAPPSGLGGIDSVVMKALADSGVPSASIAVVKDGKVVYARAYGDARLDPKTPAQPGMRYKIASNSKQIAAAAILLLAEDKKLSLDDRVARFFPSLTRANDITIRQLLSHTSGYQDYYPLDYMTAWMARETTPEKILDLWAKKPLDFEPGTEWQYSNTNYVIAGLIVEKLAKRSLFDFLRARIFEPLGMRSPIDVGRQKWSDADPQGYVRLALGPPRPATPEGASWMYAAGELAMTASDLALWDISLMNGTILKPASLKALGTEALLKNGCGTGYALGLSVRSTEGRRRWAHSGGASGFVSQNVTFPDDRACITVLTNGEGGAAGDIERQIEKIVMAPVDPDAARDLDHARRLFLSLQKGEVDRSLLDADLSAYFTSEAVSDFETSLKALGPPSSFVQTSASHRGGMTHRWFAIRAGNASLNLSVFIMPGGKLSQYLITPGAR